MLTIVGAGVQAWAHFDLLPLVRDIDEIRVSSLRLEDAERLAGRDPRAVAVAIGELDAAVRSSAIVCLCTHSGEPVVDAEWNGAGTHVTSVGYREPRAGSFREIYSSVAGLFVETRQAFEPTPCTNLGSQWRRRRRDILRDLGVERAAARFLFLPQFEQAHHN